jgi:hypothetical protein
VKVSHFVSERSVITQPEIGMYRLLGATTAFCLVSSLAMAGDKPDHATFKLYPNPALPNILDCLSENGEVPRAVVEVKRGDLNDTGIIRVKGLKPNLDFDVFTVQRSPLGSDGKGAPTPFKGFGLAWYQSDLQSDHHGNAQVIIKTILLDQIFGFDADVVVPATSTTPATTVLKPTNTFHLGFWFNDPNDAAKCGFDPSKPTPFNGEHKAGPLAMISAPVEPAGLGPLCTSPTGLQGPDDSGADPTDSTVLASNP